MAGKGEVHRLVSRQVLERQNPGHSDYVCKFANQLALGYLEAERQDPKVDASAPG